MSLNEIKCIIISSFEEVGILVDVDNSDVDLRDKIADSLQFITAILQLEENLGVTLTDELIAYENLASLDAFAQSIKHLLDDLHQAQQDET